MTALTNRSKADQDPSTWLPPAQAVRCQYVTDWVAVKTRWNLRVDQVERDALVQLVSACPNDQLVVEPAL